MIFNLISRTFKQLNTKYKLLFFIAILIGSISAFLESINLLLLMPFVRLLISPEAELNNSILKYLEFLNFHNGDLFKILVITLIFLFTSSGIIRAINIKFISILSADIGHLFSTKLLTNIISQDFLFFNKVGVGFICSSADYSLTKVVNIIFSFLQTIVALLIATSLMITISISTGNLIFVLILLIGLSYIVIAKNVQNKYSQNSYLINNSVSNQTQDIKDALSSIQDFIIYNDRNEFIKKYKSVDFNLRRSIAQNDYLATVPRILVESISLLIILIVTILLKNAGFSSSLLLSKVGLFAVASQRLLPTLQQLYSGWSTLLRYSSELKQILYLLELKPYYSLVAKNSYKPIQFKKINLKDISYKYLNAESNKSKSNFSINDLNIELNANKMIAIYGPSGSGKTTLVNIISGLIKPYKGKVFVDNKDINESSKSLQKWQSSIAYVPQTIYLRGSTLVENITDKYSLEGKDLPWFLETLRLCQIEDIYDEERGSSTSRVGEGGSRLSGGQKQRIAIAKAIFSKRKLLILDEPTSGLDSSRQKKIIDLLKKLSINTTIIIITHSNFVAKSCDYRIEIKLGKISKIITNN